MARISRPYQIALVAVLALFLAWFVLLRSHGATPAAGSSSPSASTTTGSSPSSGSSASSTGSSISGAAEQAHKAAQPSKVYNGPVPGIHGLSKDVRKAHETVGASQRQAAAQEAAAGSASAGHGSTTASGSATGSGSGSGTGSGSAASSGSTALTGGASATHTGSAGTGHSNAVAGAHRSPADVIASQLGAGRVVLLLFWNPHSSDDAAVHSQVQAVAHSMKHTVAVHFAKADEVGSFGTVTREVSVYQTPTLLVIGKKGLVSTITGLTDAFAIEQAVREAEH